MSDAPSYIDLQHHIDQLVGKLGLPRTIQLIRHFSENARIPVAKNHRLKLLTEYIISQCIDEFDLDGNQFCRCSKWDYRQGRMACYHLLKKFTGCSAARISERFGWGMHTVYYFCQKCDDILSVPQFHADFVARYSQLETRILHFITTLK